MNKTARYALYGVGAWMLVGAVGVGLGIDPGSEAPAPTPSAEPSAEPTPAERVQANRPWVRSATYSEANNYLGALINVDGGWTAADTVDRMGRRIVEIARVAADNGLRLRVGTHVETMEGDYARAFTMDWTADALARLDWGGDVTAEDVLRTASDVNRKPIGQKAARAYCDSRDLPADVRLCRD